LQHLLKLSVLVACLQFNLLSAAPSFGPYRATILEVREADTLIVEVEIWPNLIRRVFVRLEGIDAPEPTKARGRASCELKAAKIAIEFVKSYILKAETIVVSRVTPIKSTSNHVFARVIIDDKDLSEILVNNKYAISTGGLSRKRWSCKNIH